MDKLGAYIVPPIIVGIVLFGAFRGVGLFDAFKEGAKEGIESLVSIAPSLIGLVLAVTMLNASGFLELASEFLSPVCSFLGIPSEIVPLALIRPISGSGAFAVLSDILNSQGADSIAGKTASVIAGSTETTFYAVAVYYGAAGIKKTRFTIPAAFTADIAGIIFAVLTVKLLCF